MRKYLNSIGMTVFIKILYPAVKEMPDIDFEEVCRKYPEYAERAESDTSKRTLLSSTKSIIRNGLEREALTLIAESARMDERLIQMANRYLYLLDHQE